MADGRSPRLRAGALFDGGLFDAEAASRWPCRWTGRRSGRPSKPAAKDWAEIDPSILGTLFVQGLDPKRMEDLFRTAGTHD